MTVALYHACQAMKICMWPSLPMTLAMTLRLWSFRSVESFSRRRSRSAAEFSQSLQSSAIHWSYAVRCFERWRSTIPDVALRVDALSLKEVFFRTLWTSFIDMVERARLVQSDRYS